MDEHFRMSEPAANMPVLLGLLTHWYYHAYGTESHAVLPYVQNLHLFPAFLQQLDMESLGKQVDRDGNNLDSRGYYNDPDFGLLAAGHLLRGGAKVGESVQLKIARDGTILNIPCTLLRRNSEDYLVDPYMFDRGPRFLILGGLLFQELTQNYLQLAGREWRDRAPFRLVYALGNQDDFLKQGRHKLVFLSGVLPAPGLIGYERLRNLIVTSVNNKPINDVKDLAEALKSPTDGIHKIEFSDFPKVIYVDAAQADLDNKEFVPARYRIRELQRLD
jgi:hypothetical protein